MRTKRLQLTRDSSVLVDWQGSGACVEATMRYLPMSDITRSDCLEAAALIGQFSHLLDPNVSTADAVAELRRIRKAYHIALEADPS